MDRRSWTLLLALSAIWGASYMFIEIGIRDFSPAMVAWSRVALAAVVLLAVAGARGALRGVLGRWPLVVAVGAAQVAGPFLLIAAGQQAITSSLAGILITSAPLFAALLALRFDHEERSTGLRLVGVVMGFVGVVVLLGVDLGGSGDELLGGLAVVLAGLGYAVGGFIVKLRLSDAPAIGVAAWVIVASTLILAVPAFATLPAAAPAAGPVAAVVALGVVGTGVAFALYYELITTVGPARTLIVTYLCPAFAVVYGATLLDESITATTLAGLALILAGSWLAAEGRIRRRRAAEPVPGGAPEPTPAVGAVRVNRPSP